MEAGGFVSHGSHALKGGREFKNSKTTFWVRGTQHGTDFDASHRTLMHAEMKPEAVRYLIGTVDTAPSPNVERAHSNIYDLKATPKG